MGSETTPLTLPIVDLSGADLQPGSESWALVRAQVWQALEPYGCFEVVYTKSPPNLRRSTFRALQELFALPLATKLRNTSPKPNHGYLGQLPQLPLYESMGIDDATLDEEVKSITTRMWPEGNPIFSETICSFSKDVCVLDNMVRRMVLESLGVEMYYDSHLESTNYLLRAMKYKGLEADEPQIGLMPHTDQSVLSIICQTHEGIEIRTKEGDWFPISVSPNSFIVMIGDSFLAWTNGRVQSSLHRVMISGNEDRYSVGLFSIPRPGCIVQAPEELVDEENPLLFKPYDFHEFLDAFNNSNECHKYEWPLKAYCGAL